MNSVTKVVTILALTLGLPAAAVLGFKLDSDCKSNGFFRNPEDCTRFYRCVDLTGKGHFKKYTFSCPVGTVFDESVMVCNHPWAAPPCDNGEEAEEELPEQVIKEEEVVTEATVEDIIEIVAEVAETTTQAAEEQGGQNGGNDGDDSMTVIVAPTFDFSCSNKGIFGHDSDCARFWLCKIENGKPELYKCPSGYLFSDDKRRCVKEEETSCVKIPDMVRLRSEPNPILLRVSELNSFFSRWASL